MSYSVELTDRDVKLISFLRQQGVATSDQLIAMFFTSSGSFRGRIARLIKVGIIEAVPLISGVAAVPSRMIELRNILQERGRRWQQIRLYRLTSDVTGEQGSSVQMGLSEPIFWQHQFGLTEIQNLLRRYLPEGILLSDPEVKREWSRYKFGSNVPIPDLVWRNDEVEIAFEFERTNKGDNKYWDRMSKYHRSKYVRVLYVANTDRIAATLIKCAERFPNVGVTTRSDLEKVYIGIEGYQKIQKFLAVIK